MELLLANKLLSRLFVILRNPTFSNQQPIVPVNEPVTTIAILNSGLRNPPILRQPREPQRREKNPTTKKAQPYWLLTPCLPKLGNTYPRRKGYAFPSKDHEPLSRENRVPETFGNYFFDRKFSNFESPPHTNCLRAPQETGNFNSEFEKKK